MTLPMVTCPLCCRPGFSTSDSLCSALVDVASRILCCPICNHVVTGLDKFTIHLFGHSSRHNSNATSNNNTRVQVLGNNEITDLNTNLRDEKSYNSLKHISPSLLCLRSDNGQVFSITPNESINLKNVTINTKNYITNTNIMTTPTNENVAKRKFSELFERDNVSASPEPVFSYGGESGQSWPSIPSVASDNITSNSNEREFESCKELLTKGDFSTSGDEFIEKKEERVHKESNKESEEGQQKTKEFGCNICTYTFPNNTILTMHKQLVHKGPSENEGSKRKLLNCNHCTRTFSLRSSLMIHNRVAHAGGFSNGDNVELSNQQKPDHSCNVCGKFFKREAHLLQHLKVHDEKQWQCSICSKKFTTKYFLKKHRRLHTGEMPYTCKMCNKSFTFQQSYHKHLLYHTNDKPYCCSRCGRLFKELSTLHNHERIHSGEKPFSCETCGKAFRQRVSYLVHRRIHTGAMPYKCTACNKSFRYKISQRTHKCTAEPPGIVVRSEGYLVQRLQAALNKDKLRDDGKTEEKILPSLSKSIQEEERNSQEEMKISDPLNEPTVDKSVRSDDINLDSKQEDKSNKNINDKPHQIYLLLKGPHEETYYQPLFIPPQNILPISSSNDQEESEHKTEHVQIEEMEVQHVKTQDEEIVDQSLLLGSHQSGESSDLVSFVLSPTLPSPSDQFRNLTLSPERSGHLPSQLDPLEGFDGELITMLNPDDNGTQHDNSTFLDSFTDDALKELLFGSSK